MSLRSSIRAFLRGMASMVDLFPQTPRRYFDNDADAIRSDWEAVGGDLRRAMAAVRVEHADGDHTIVLGSIIPGPRTDPVEPDYSWLEADHRNREGQWP